MATIGYALRQAFMPNRDYDGGGRLRLHRLVIVSLAAVLGMAIVIAVCVSLTIVFPGDSGRRPLCRDRRIQVLPLVNVSMDADSDAYHGAFYLTDEEAADYYWMVVFLPSAIVFLVSVVYLLAEYLPVDIGAAWEYFWIEFISEKPDTPLSLFNSRNSPSDLIQINIVLDHYEEMNGHLND